LTASRVAPPPRASASFRPTATSSELASFRSIASGASRARPTAAALSVVRDTQCPEPQRYERRGDRRVHWRQIRRSLVTYRGDGASAEPGTSATRRFLRVTTACIRRWSPPVAIGLATKRLWGPVRCRRLRGLRSPVARWAAQS
jgi:hypothetical protein